MFSVSKWKRKRVICPLLWGRGLYLVIWNVLSWSSNEFKKKKRKLLSNLSSSNLLFLTIFPLDYKLFNTVRNYLIHHSNVALHCVLLCGGFISTGHGKEVKNNILFNWICRMECGEEEWPVLASGHHPPANDKCFNHCTDQVPGCEKGMFSVVLVDTTCMWACSVLA